MDDKKDKQPQSVDITVDDDGVNENEVAENDKDDEKKDVPNYLEMLQRLQADFDNYRKHSEKEKEDLAQFIRGNIISQLLPVVDDFERLLNAESDNQEIKNGAQLIYNNLISIFKQFGLKEFNDLDESFDPNIHEALTVKETSFENDGKILETWQKGYWLRDKLLRPAKVIVGQNKNDKNENSNIDE